MDFQIVKFYQIEAGDKIRLVDRAPGDLEWLEVVHLEATEREHKLTVKRENSSELFFVKLLAKLECDFERQLPKTAIVPDSPSEAPPEAPVSSEPAPALE